MIQLNPENRWTRIASVWSASPTPFLDDLSIDSESVHRMVAHHRDLGVGGIMLGGTCGEGPWMPEEDLLQLVRSAREAAGPDYPLAVQVTDNSPRRMLQRIEKCAAAGADLALIAGPYFLMNPTPDRIFNCFAETANQSPLPVIYYDRGENDRYPLPADTIEELLGIPNIVMIKDSSRSPERREHILAVKQFRSDLVYFTGDEFAVTKYVSGGADGVLLGGGIFNARFAAEIIRLLHAGKGDAAAATDQTMMELMRRIYGGPEIECWLTGLKYFLQRLGIFGTTASYLEYPLDERFRKDIDSIVDTPEQYDNDAMLLTSACTVA